VGAHADGVPEEDVYKVLNTPEGVELFAADTIKGHVRWRLVRRRVAPRRWRGSNHFGVERTYLQCREERGQALQDHLGPPGLDFDYWIMPKGGPRLDLAYKFISYASQPDKMANQTKYISYGPANKDAIPNIDPAILPDLPTAPDNMKNALIIDPNFWGDKGDELRERFNAWLAQ
jgi:putative spermidine/putrescine transport system substrate-binding protein